MTDQEFERVLQTYRALWPSAALPAAPGLAVWRALWDMQPAATIMQALQVRALEGSEFGPPPGVVVAKALELGGDAETPWNEVWADLLAIHGRGMRSQDGAVRTWAERLNAMDTANTIGVSYEEDWPTVGAQWRQTYQTLVARGRQDQTLALVPGDAPRIAAARGRTGMVRLGELL